ncbi:hypothetical protein GGS21DRAFT_536471 [Xylaria nigripes]|nr:hypothetical protein GGS21DRAFT_536471 [Xylaria nigripes]
MTCPRAPASLVIFQRSRSYPLPSESTNPRANSSSSKTPPLCAAPARPHMTLMNSEPTRRGPRRTGSSPRGLGRKAFTILQANVQHSGPSHDTHLGLAGDAEADIILVQEPWACSTWNEDMLKSHPSCQVFSPRGDWKTDPPRSYDIRQQTLGGGNPRVSGHGKPIDRMCLRKRPHHIQRIPPTPMAGR